MTKVRKLTNVSERDISVVLSDGNSVHMSPGCVLVEAEVKSLESIREFVRVEQDLSEVMPIHEGKQQLRD